MAWWETVRESVSRPVRFFENVHPKGPPPIFYYWVNALIGSTLNLLGLIIVHQLRPLSASTALLWAILSPPLWLYIGAAIVHVSGLLCGSAKMGFDATLRVVAYSSAPLLLLAIPLRHIGWIPILWVLVLDGIGMAKVHRSSAARAVLTIVLPLVVGASVAVAFLFLAFQNGHVMP